MEAILNSQEPLFEEIVDGVEVVSTAKPFIGANTIESTFEEVKNRHVIPVFIKDNEPTISHSDFIDVTSEVVSELYPLETILKPAVRLSHPIKGRVPSAKDKPAKDLLEAEKTLYFERMAFVIEIASVYDEIEGQRLSLVVGGVKSYSLDNLYNKKGSDEHFKVFIGFKNSVCTNLCVSTDGYMGNLKVNSIGQLRAGIRTLIEGYNASFNIHTLRQLNDYGLTESQFAHLVGRCRMYNHLPNGSKNQVTPLLLSDTQLGMVVKDFYRDNSFCRDSAGNINLWRLFNLFTSANKSSYIDTFLDRSVNAFQFTQELKMVLDNKTSSWYLN